MIKNLLLFIVIYFTITLFSKYYLISSIIVSACELFLYKILPSLFPMFIISSLLINLNFIKYTNKLLKTLFNKLFNINENASYIFIISMLSGFPSSAKTTKEMYELNLIDKKTANKIILFSHFANPLFILSMVKYNAIKVLIAHYLGNFLIGIIIRNLFVSEYKVNSITKDNTNIANILTIAITNAVNTLLFILGTIITFSLISKIINNNFLNIILELSQGLNFINTLNINPKIMNILQCGLLSFGGLCVHFQIYGILNDLKIKYLPYLLTRILHTLISIVILILIY